MASLRHKEMADYETILKNSESIVDILSAQCEDLESLLSLARQETEAVKKGDFLSLVDIVSERARIGERLETFQRQTVDLKQCIEGSPMARSLASRVVEVARLTIEQDRSTTERLSKQNSAASEQISRIGKGKTSIARYMQTDGKGLVCDQSF
jgi:septation ring formation regulator EzrA